MCFLCHLPLENHLVTLKEARPFLDKILGMRVNSGEELDKPPGKCCEVFEKDLALCLKPVAHAGKEGCLEYVHVVLDELHVKRLDLKCCCLGG